MKPSLTQSLSRKDLRLLALILLILLLMAIIWNHAFLWTFLMEYGLSLISWFLGGLFASLVAGLIIARYCQKEVQEKLCDLLDELPKGIGGPFTRSLLSYYPRTSKRIANIIGDHTAKIYNEHYDQVAVVEATDTYRLKGSTIIKINGTQSPPLWDVDFHASWVWQNDSRVRQYPLKDFRILICAPHYAEPYFRTTLGKIRRVEEKKRADVFLQNRNTIITTVEYPDSEYPQGKIEDDVLDKLIKIDMIRIKREDEKDWIDVTAPERTNDNLPIVCYRSFRLPADKVDMDKPLEQGKSITMEYWGNFRLPIYLKNEGRIIYTASDTIAGKYSLFFVYKPADVDPCKEASGLWYLNRCVEQLGPDITRLEDIPDGFGPLERGEEDFMTLHVEPLIKDIHQIRLIWHRSQGNAKDR